MPALRSIFAGTSQPFRGKFHIDQRRGRRLGNDQLFPGERSPGNDELVLPDVQRAAIRTNDGRVGIVRSGLAAQQVEQLVGAALLKLG